MEDCRVSIMLHDKNIKGDFFKRKILDAEMELIFTELHNRKAII
jgi:hypothetical protein